MIAVPNSGFWRGGEELGCRIFVVGESDDDGGLRALKLVGNSWIVEGVVASMSVVESLSVSRWMSIVLSDTGAFLMSDMR